MTLTNIAAIEKVTHPWQILECAEMWPPNREERGVPWKTRNYFHQPFGFILSTSCLFVVVVFFLLFLFFFLTCELAKCWPVQAHSFPQYLLLPSHQVLHRCCGLWHYCEAGAWGRISSRLGKQQYFGGHVCKWKTYTFSCQQGKFTDKSSRYQSLSLGLYLPFC